MRTGHSTGATAPGVTRHLPPGGCAAARLQVAAPPPASRWLRCCRHSPEPTIASTVRAGFPPATASATKRSPRSGRTCAAPDDRNRPNASARAPIGQVPARDDPRSSWPRLG